MFQRRVVRWWLRLVPAARPVSAGVEVSLTNESGEFTPEELARLDSLDVIALLRRNSGEPNFYWRVREAVLNRAADEIKRLLESEAKAERIAVHWQTEAHRLQSEPTENVGQVALNAFNEFGKSMVPPKPCILCNAGWLPLVNGKHYMPNGQIFECIPPRT